MGNWRMEWVASTLHTTSKHGVSSITTADAHTSGCQQSTELTSPPPADLNEIVCFAERRNLVSERVSSHFNCPLPDIQNTICNVAKPRKTTLHPQTKSLRIDTDRIRSTLKLPEVQLETNGEDQTDRVRNEEELHKVEDKQQEG